MMGDIVLVSLRDFQDEKGDIIAKYNSDEAKNLKTYGELPENTKINETTGLDDEDAPDDGIVFEDGGEVIDLAEI